jgi:hypothetical protein
MDMKSVIEQEQRASQPREVTFMAGGLAIIGFAIGLFLIHAQTVAVAMAARIAGGPWKPADLEGRLTLFVCAFLFAIGGALFGRGFGLCLLRRGSEPRVPRLSNSEAGQP